MSTLKQSIAESAKAALRSGDKARRGALRLILAEIQQREVDTRTTLDDAEVQSLIAKLVKKGRDAAAQFEQAGREDLAAKESAEIEVFESFLPRPLTEAIASTGAQGLRDMGKVMAHLKNAVAGRADLGALSAAVRAALAER